MKRTIVLKESELISLIERMIKESDNKLPGKTVGDLKNILVRANPNGFLIMVNGKESKWITYAAHLNVDSYGYKLNGVDITQDNKFVGLPFYDDAHLTDSSEKDIGSISDDVKSIIKGKHIYPIKHIIKQLETYSDNDYLMLFDGSLVNNITLNHGKTVGFKNVYGQVYTYKAKENDFVLLYAGEKTNNFFRGNRIKESLIKEYGEDSGGQDMTWGIYSRDNEGLGQSIDFRMMNPMNVALEIEGVLPEKYIDIDVDKAVDDYIKDASINIQVANKYMKDEDWWDTLYYNIDDIRRNKTIKEEKNTKKSVTIIKWFFGSDTNENEMSFKLMSDEEISKFVEQLKSKKIKYKLNNTGFYKNTPKIEYWETKNIKEETGTASVGGFEPAFNKPIKRKIYKK